MEVQRLAGRPARSVGDAVPAACWASGVRSPRHPPSPQFSPIQKKAGKVVGTQETVSHLSGCRTSEVGEMACLLRCSDEH